MVKLNYEDMLNPKFQVFKSSSNGEYYYRLKAANGEVILSGEGYVTKQGCLNGISSVKENAVYDSRYDRRTATNGQHYFVLKAFNGEIIGKSELYWTTSSRENGIESVKNTAPRAMIEDLTYVNV